MTKNNYPNLIAAIMKKLFQFICNHGPFADSSRYQAESRLEAERIISTLEERVRELEGKIQTNLHEISYQAECRQAWKNNAEQAESQLKGLESGIREHRDKIYGADGIGGHISHEEEENDEELYKLLDEIQKEVEK